MNVGLEEVCGNKLELCGPVIDSYLLEMEEQIAQKLTMSKATGLASPVVLFVPWAIFRHMTVLFRGYGSDVRVSKSKTKITKITTRITDINTADKIFSPARFEGQNFLRKRHFRKIPNKDGKIEST